MGARSSAGQKRACPVTVEERRSMATVDASRRKVPVAWEALEDAFENNAPEVHSYLHLVTGEVIRVVDGVADPATHARIAADPNYMRVEPVSSREQYRWMERFVASVEDEFDILISMNRAAEIETVGQLVDAVGQLQQER